MIDPVQAIIAQSQDLIADLESRRQRYLQLYTMGLPMVFAASCAVAAIKTGADDPFPWTIIGIITAIIGLVTFQLLNGLYRSQTKKAFLGQIAEAIGLTYHPRGVFPVDDFNPHSLLPPFDKVDIEDGFEGRIHDVGIAFQEVTLTDITPSQNKGEADREDTVFKGLFIKIRIGKILKAHTVVLPRNVVQVFFRTTFSKFEKINLVSPAFEEKFNTLGTDQVEARYVLDPAFMENFMQAGELLGARWLNASFKGQDIAITVERKHPMFEIGMLWTRLSEKHLNAVADELRMMTRLINVLKLNPYTGLGASLPQKDH